jgi:MOSC domain-containing protein YiiM
VTVLSVNVGRPRPIDLNGTIVYTSIWKTPVAGPVRVTRLNLDGDEQSDLSVHGGIDKAVYAYPSEHYPSWADELRTIDLPWSSFGENLTTEGLAETDVRIGDRFKIGTAEVVVTQPRLPCFKLGLRLNRDDIIRRFVERNRSGFYLSVAVEGVLGAGSRVELLHRDEDSPTVAEVSAIRNGLVDDAALMRRLVDLPALTAGWREHFRRRLADRDRPSA